MSGEAWSGPVRCGVMRYGEVVLEKSLAGKAEVRLGQVGFGKAFLMQLR